jgi:PAS domain S-box-containing protein
MTATPTTAGSDAVSQPLSRMPHPSHDDDLMKSELLRLRRVLSLGSIGTWDWDIAADAIEWDHGHYQLCGVPEDGTALRPQLFFELVHPDDLPKLFAALDTAREHGTEYTCEYRIRRKDDGAERWFEGRGVFFRDQGNVVRASGIILDITDRKVLQRELDAQRQRYEADATRFRLLFEKNPAPMWVFDIHSLRFLAVNEAAIREYGWSRDEFLGMTILDIRPEADVPGIRRMAAEGFTGAVTHRAVRHRTRNGAVRTVVVTGDSIEWEGLSSRLVLAIDETQRRQLEEQLRQAQKMEAIGQLAGGVAHDFNNLLTVILGNLEFARRRAEADTLLVRDLDEVFTAATRARTLVAQLLAFSRKQIVQMRAVDLNHVVRQAEQMLRRVIGEEIVLRVELDPELPLITADAAQLEQALLNLAVNARDAMLSPQSGGRGGTLIIRTGIVEHHDSDSARWPSLSPGRYVEVQVADSGHGMDAATRARAFEPFFTTKPLGAGTGLGLPSVQGIVEQSRGAIIVESGVQQGTTFFLRFPLREHPMSNTPAESHPAIPAHADGTVLVVEDEPAVRTALARMAEQMGMEVLTAADGLEALDVWRTHGDAISAVVTDVRMPNMSGRELADALRRERPTLPIIFVSGYAGDATMVRSVHDRFLEKPFGSSALAVLLNSPGS